MTLGARGTRRGAVPPRASASARPPAISAHNLVVSYGPVRALDDVSLTISASRICGLVGVNGSGKSTLFKALMGQLTPERGEVRLEGLDSRQARKVGLVGYVPQSENVDWRFPVSVREVAMMGRYGRMNPLRIPRREDRAAVAEALERVELTELADRQIGQLSGGQKKRAFVARGLAQGARILLLDEPFAGVDKRSEATITAVLKEYAADGGTVMVSTHDLQALPALADEAILLHQRILLHSTPEEILRPENLALSFGVGVAGDAVRAEVEPTYPAGPGPETGTGPETGKEAAQ